LFLSSTRLSREKDDRELKALLIPDRPQGNSGSWVTNDGSCIRLGYLYLEVVHKRLLRSLRDSHKNHCSSSFCIQEGITYRIGETQIS
jgi:hypothetical protein